MLEALTIWKNTDSIDDSIEYAAEMNYAMEKRDIAIKAATGEEL